MKDLSSHRQRYLKRIWLFAVAYKSIHLRILFHLVRAPFSLTPTADTVLYFKVMRMHSFCYLHKAERILRWIKKEKLLVIFKISMYENNKEFFDLVGRRKGKLTKVFRYNTSV